jgi:uncharacterized membrane protein
MRSLPKYWRVEKEEDGSNVDAPAPRPDRHRWIVQVWMISSFTAGVVIAVVHHVYYTKMNNTVVGSAARQQWPLRYTTSAPLVLPTNDHRFGTTLAFLFKACLAHATGIAYIQWLWRQCRQKAIPIGAIDAAFTVDRNIFIFLNMEFVFEFPFAAGLMVIFWYLPQAMKSLFAANIPTRCIPISSLITPATLGVASMPNAWLFTTSVYQPSINNFDFQTSTLYTKWGDDSPTSLLQMFTIIASTGQLLGPNTPWSSENSSYTVDMVVPLVRCQASSETVRSITAASAYNRAILGYELANSTVFHPENLTFTVNEGAYIGDGPSSFPREIGYYAMKSDGKNSSSVNGLNELWIAIAEIPDEGRTTTSSQASNNIGFYTCALRNASVTTHVAFVNSVPTLHATAIQEVEPTIYDNRSWVPLDELSDSYAWANYDTFGDMLFDLLLGFVMRTDLGGGHTHSTDWATTIDQTVFATAHDFAALTAAWKGRSPAWEPGNVGPQKKNLTTIIEEFSLNASWSLMSMPKYK